LSDRLGEYRRKRKAEETPEPAGGASPSPATRDRFVIQEHSARRLHWDLRLERDGVLVSWALPSGVPLDPDKNAKAVHTEDHPLEYIDFHGEIPKGNYGAGTMTIWDTGTYETEKFEEGKVIVTLHGERAQGRYALFRAGRDERDWMIHRMDPAPEWLEQMPAGLRPMEAEPGELPGDEEDWAYELLWPGQRIIAYNTPGKLRLASPDDTDLTSRFPEVRPLTRALGSATAILDGVLVAGGPDGKPSRDALEARMALTSDSAIRRRAKSDPVTLHLFDVLYREGRVLCGEPYGSRRERLEDLGLNDAAWVVPGNHRGNGNDLLERVPIVGIDGIVAKRLASAYRPGPSAGDWVKVRSTR
jgi:bifunctional non-homologous end joining protein LigD